MVVAVRWSPPYYGPAIVAEPAVDANTPDARGRYFAYPVYHLQGRSSRSFLTCQLARGRVKLGIGVRLNHQSHQLFRPLVSQLMDDRLKELAQSRYQQREFLQTLFELAIENQWFDVRQMVQHDMAKAIIADYSQEQGRGFLDGELFLDNWESVVEVGWGAFCAHTGLTRDRVNHQLQQLGENL